MIQQVVRKYVVSGICVAFGIALVWLLTGRACLTGRPWFFVAGTWLLLVAGIGRLGWKIQTFGGESPAERLDAAVFVVLASLGTAAFLADYLLGLTS